MRVILVGVPTSTHLFAFTASAVLSCTVWLAACSSPSNTLFSSSSVANQNPSLPAGGGGGSGASGGSEVPSGGVADISIGGSNTDQAGADNSAGSPAAGAATGGATAGSSGASGASGGSGGAPPPPPPPAPSVCDSKLTVPHSLIANFEDGVSGWAGYLGNGPWQVNTSQPGAAGTDQALRFSGGNAETSGVYHLLPCSDVSSFDGIQFWAKGKGGDKVRFLAVIPATDPTDGIGDCTAKCSDHPGLAFTLDKDWALHRIAFGDLKQYGFGAKATFNSVINAVLWINDGAVQDFDFSIDEVALYKDATNQ